MQEEKEAEAEDALELERELGADAAEEGQIEALERETEQDAPLPPTADTRPKARQLVLDESREEGVVRWSTYRGLLVACVSSQPDRSSRLLWLTYRLPSREALSSGSPSSSHTPGPNSSTF